VRRLVLNEWRGRSRRSAVFVHPSSDVKQREAVSPDSPAAEASAGELAKAIDSALQSLPDEQRTAMILRRYDEMPYEEIAEVLGTTVPAVKSLLFRARETLRVRLAAWL
jgi:RNA polymerase sigma-70 factor (ECF subfamily)